MRRWSKERFGQLAKYHHWLSASGLFGTSSRIVNASVASVAESDQIMLGIVPRLASECAVVYLQSAHAPAVLTSPSVAFEYLSV